MSIFVHAQGIRTVYAGRRGGVKNWQNYVHVVIECPLAVHFQVTMYVKCYLSLKKWEKESSQRVHCVSSKYRSTVQKLRDRWNFCYYHNIAKKELSLYGKLAKLTMTHHLIM